MATVIAQQPDKYALCRSPVIVTLFDSANGNTNFRYVLDVYIWHGVESSTPGSYSYRLSKPANTSSRAVFDLKELIAESIVQLTTINQTNTYRSAGTTAVNVIVKAGYTSDAGDSLANVTGTRFTSSYGYTLFTEGINAKKLPSSLPPQYTLTDRTIDIYINPNKVSTLPIFQEASGVVDEMQVIDYTGADDMITLSSTPTNSADRIKYIPIDPTYLTSATSLDLSRDYTINILSVDIDGVTILKQYNVHLVCEPKFQMYQIWFVNRYGVWDFILCSKRSNSSVTRESKDYLHNTSVISGGILTYSDETHTTTDYNVDGMEPLTLNTGFQGEGLGILITQLMMSEQILIEDSSGNLLPYRIKDSSKDILKSVNDRNINYTLNFEPSFNIINSIR